MKQLVLYEVCQPRNVIDFFASRFGNKKFTIEAECIKVWGADGTQVKSISTVGYTTASFVYFNEILNNEFLFLVKSNGELHIFDQDLNMLDRLRTEIVQPCDKETFFAFDQYNNKLYLNLEHSTVHCVPLKIENSVPKFLHDGQMLQIFQFSATIRDMSYGPHINEYTNEEFDTISVLLQDSAESCLIFRTVYLLDPNDSTSGNKWSILIPNVDLNIVPTSHKRIASITTIPSVGFLILTCKGILFLSLPNGPQNRIDGVTINKLYERVNLFVEDEVLQDDTFYDVAVLATITDKMARFDIITGKGKYIKLKLKKVKEEETQFIIHWELTLSANGEYLSIQDLGDRPEKCIQRCSISNVDGRIFYMVLLPANKVIYGFPYAQATSRVIDIGQMHSIYSKYFGNVLKQHVFCSTDFRNKSNISTCDYYLEDKFTIHELLVLDSSDSNTQFSDKKFTPTEGRIKTTNDDSINTIHCKDNEFVTAQGTSMNTQNLCGFCNIWDGSQNEMAYITANDGSIHWSNTQAVYSIENFNRFQHYVIESVTLRNGKNISVVATGNTFHVLENYGESTTTFHLQNVFVSAKSLCVNGLDGGNYHIIISDIQGDLYITDTAGKSLEEFNLHNQGFQLIRLFDCPGKFLMYNQNAIILISYSNVNSQYQFVPLTTKITAGHIQHVLGSNDLAVIDSNTNKAYRIEMKDSQLQRKWIDVTVKPVITKFIRLTATSRYAICSGYEVVSQDPLRVKSGIYLYDLPTTKIIDKFDIDEKYSQAAISDIAAMSYDKPDCYNGVTDNKRSFAEQLLLSQCFLISLTFDAADEDRNASNLLLFSLDDERAKITYHTSFSTGFGIASIQNYLHEYVIIAGESIQVLKVDYSFKENLFALVGSSNALAESGLIKNVINLPGAIPENKSVTKRAKNSLINDSFLLLNICEGISQVKISGNVGGANTLEFQISRVAKSEQYTILADIYNEGHCSFFETVNMGSYHWCIVSLGSEKLRLYFVSEDQEYCSTEFCLPGQITSLSKADDNRRNPFGQKRSLVAHDDFVALFCVTTLCGGVYVLGFIKTTGITLSAENKHKNACQLRYISEDSNDEDDEENELQLIDTRVLDSCDITEYLEHVVPKKNGHYQSVELK
ncbi:Mlo127p KNAG_0I00400 [Huiozyma naganishii CBS 8797]|uniref:Cleavage/polyadenylation specificity factor A subunit N-terminal domain-containing protein n=1 Tax=Huiozyma naganishii (strain ATCC MYA-139 / BCRC 22969 / CBS 8797 / KCTC 17520 / NBRC 10181 / NCYC 3082 / Yp74L-3) TaxID=1071383 RepID=J7SA01_HUIN7|nr:hypothetical protein KNAG_0I00400 [Kazachstania naganishii CBS 8797]CCK71831.1 hypothetical protein KNAG_0I00400 [Kazachstania naganishii CBS 8797]